MRHIYNYFKAISFWGFFVLLLLLLVFRVHIRIIIFEAQAMNSYVSLICLYLLFSMILFPLLAIFNIISDTATGDSVLDVISIGMMTNLWPPYNGFLLRGFTSDIPLYLMYIAETLTWWFLMVTGVLAIINTPDNQISIFLNQYSFGQIIIKICLSIGIYFLLLIIARALLKRFCNGIYNEE